MNTVHFVLGADLRGGHLGLAAQAKSHNIKLQELNDMEAVVFINAAKNKMKAYSWNGVISYVKFDDPKRPLNLMSLDEIPRAFNRDGTMNYKKALKSSLEKMLKQKITESVRI